MAAGLGRATNEQEKNLVLTNKRVEFRLFKK